MPHKETYRKDVTGKICHFKMNTTHSNSIDGMSTQITQDFNIFCAAL